MATARASLRIFSSPSLFFPRFLSVSLTLSKGETPPATAAPLKQVKSYSRQLRGKFNLLHYETYGKKIHSTNKVKNYTMIEPKAKEETRKKAGVRMLPVLSHLTVRATFPNLANSNYFPYSACFRSGLRKCQPLQVAVVVRMRVHGRAGRKAQ